LNAARLKDKQQPSHLLPTTAPFEGKKKRTLSVVKTKNQKDQDQKDQKANAKICS
jgi:hypothetical protein